MNLYNRALHSLGWLLVTLTLVMVHLTAPPYIANAEPYGWDCDRVKSSTDFEWSAYQYCRSANGFSHYRIKVKVVNPPYPPRYKISDWVPVHDLLLPALVFWPKGWTFDSATLQGKDM